MSGVKKPFLLLRPNHELHDENRMGMKPSWSKSKIIAVVLLAGLLPYETPA